MQYHGATVRTRFDEHAGADGARFEQPMRVDVLRNAAFTGS